jgi:ribosomal protein S18 acetylase RimI-like enzyme
VIEIRTATIQDLAAVATLMVELSHHHHELAPEMPRYKVADREWYEVAKRTLLDDRHTVLVAESDGGIVGFVNFHFEPKPWGRSCEVDTLAVAKDQREAGVGTMLMDECQAIALRSGAGGMRVDVLQTNERGRSFYEKAGYTIYAIRYGKPLE